MVRVGEEMSGWRERSVYCETQKPDPGGKIESGMIEKKNMENPFTKTIMKNLHTYKYTAYLLFRRGQCTRRRLLLLDGSRDLVALGGTRTLPK